MGKILINFILFIVSIILTILLFIPNILHFLYSFRWGSVIRRTQVYFLSSALAIDIMDNTMYKNLLNDWFIKKNSYKFGVRGESVSSALGKNQCIKGLTYLGRGLASVLDIIQKDHCWISINDQIYYDVYKQPDNKVDRIVTIISLLVFLVLLFALSKLLIFII